MSNCSQGIIRRAMKVYSPSECFKCNAPLNECPAREEMRKRMESREIRHEATEEIN